MIWLLPHPLSPLTHQQVVCLSFWLERAGGIGGGPKSYDSKKAWSSIDRSILFAVKNLTHLSPFHHPFPLPSACIDRQAYTSCTERRKTKRDVRKLDNPAVITNEGGVVEYSRRRQQSSRGSFDIFLRQFQTFVNELQTPQGHNVTWQIQKKLLPPLPIPIPHRKRKLWRLCRVP